MKNLVARAAFGRVAFVGLVLVSALVAGCGHPPAIGGSCDPGVSTDDPTITTINSPALECAGRTCVQANGGGAFCSAECEGPEDCQEISAGGTSCRSGFTCAVAVLRGPFACHRLCVCRDVADTSLSCAAAAP